MGIIFPNMFPYIPIKWGAEELLGVSEPNDRSITINEDVCDTIW